MFKILRVFTGALAMGAVVLPGAAFADDPKDPKMRSAAARARDRAIIRGLNQDQLAYVRKRDADRMQAFRAARAERDGRYADARADYARKMAAWRHAVAACRAGRVEYCDR
jgi:hypothetical protein